MKHSALVLLGVALAGCALPSSQDFDEERLAAVEADVRSFAEMIPRDLADRGPTAWLDHFDHGPEFFMASDGIELFPDFATADEMVRGLAPSIASLTLTWDSLRIHVLSPDWVVFAGPYRETLTDTAGIDLAFGGYASATVVRRPSGWKIQHLHWSSPVASQP